MGTPETNTAAEPVAETLPQSGGSYIRQPDGTLVLQKPKAELADLVAARQSAAANTVTPNTTPTQE